MKNQLRSLVLMLALSPLALVGCDDDGGADGGVDDAGDVMTDSGPGDAGPPPETCSDDIMNQDETDVDCGGTCGMTCVVGEMCGDNGDCVSDICNGGVCEAMPTCMDGVTNGTETDVDCGGGACPTCDTGDMCMADGDCTNMFCSGGVCTDPVCGNGMVEGAGEDCDPGTGGTPMETDMCDIDCTSVMCGDGTVNMTAGEACDGDGMGMGGETATCNADCTVAACGDGMTNATAGEDCDDGSGGTPAESMTCDIDCTAVMCGDGVANAAAGEQCDDGNMDDTDACSNSCTVNGPSVAITADATFDTDTGELDGVVSTGWQAATNQLFVSDMSIATGVTLTVIGSNPLQIISGTTIDVQGTILAAGQVGGTGAGCDSAGGGVGGLGGPGGFQGGNGGEGSASGTPSTMLNGTAGMGPGGGNPGLNDSAGGGGAGHSTVGLDGAAAIAANAGTGGPSYSGPQMLVGGSGGGGGSADDDGGGDDSGAGGGGGGGYVGLTATGALTVTGTIDASGGDGGDQDCFTTNGGDGGGGSGGSIVLRSGAGFDISSATLDVSGGAGGTAGLDGGDGADGYVIFEGGCADGVLNQDETDVDCGGATCAACPLTSSCRVDADCVAGGACSMGFCAIMACTNGVMDGMETDVDCGGPECGPCADALMCTADTDCQGSGCDTGVCVSCSDGTQNDMETDVDCGGTECAGCADGLACVAGTDCDSGACEASVCVSCSDGIQNQDETDVDCGGATCADRCGAGEMCVVDGDCPTGSTCTGGVCQGVGDTCANPIPITDGMNSVAWVASNNDYIGTTAPCGFGPTGPDIVMEYVAAANGTVSYTLSPPASTRWIVVVSSGACGTLTPEESCGSEFGSPIMGSFSVTMGNSYFFYAIDSTSGADPLPNPLPIDITFTPALAGPVLDDFERGAPLQSFWTAGGDAGWTVSSTMPINGAFSAQAGTITDDESSTLSIDVFCAAAGDVGFDYRVDSESGFDFLDFSVDSVIPTGGSWSGSVSGNASFMLTAGAHTLTWDYNKDFIASSGMDTAWIDDVRLVGCSVVGAPIAASGSSVGLAGSIDATDPQWARPITCSSTTPADHYYDAFPITNTTGAAQTVTVTAAWAGGDGYLHAYSDPLDVTSTSGCITGDDDFGSPPASGSQMASVAIANNETIWIIASTFGATDPIGAYTIDVATD